MTKASPKMPTSSTSTKNQLRSWISGVLLSWKSTPQRLGPQITAGLVDQFCGLNDVHLSRFPQGQNGDASWTILLSLVRPNSILALEIYSAQGETAGKEWSEIPLTPLLEYELQSSIRISRATLMTLFALTNASPLYSYSSASGHRSSYSSYCGQWTISWIAGKCCTVRLEAHDNHASMTDICPPSFPARVDKCVNMMTGIITDGDWRIAFPERPKSLGPWMLQERPKAFAGTSGSRHLYNLLGGNVFEIDLLAVVPYKEEGAVNVQDIMIELEIPCLAGEVEQALVYVPKQEAQLLSKALDCLPWSSISWSLHRGLKDILLAIGKPIMKRYRQKFASIVKKAVNPSIKESLVKGGWALEFVEGPMASIAESAILSESGNNGDVVRIVVGIVECIWEQSNVEDKVTLDKTEFWTQHIQGWYADKLESFEFSDGDDINASDLEKLVALTKFLVLEWSQEFNYQLYHDLPTEILFT